MTAALRDGGVGQAGVDARALALSRDFCRELTRRQAKNFYYGMKLLPEPKRSAMYALYAYMRLVDDIADDDANQRTLAQRKDDLDQWQRLTHEVFVAGQPKADTPPHARSDMIWPAFTEMVQTYRVPETVFTEMIAGQRQDLSPVPIAVFDDLWQYCYRVASVVGMASLYVWGFEGGEDTLKLSTDRGVAFQLTNVLRDLREDAARGRCYLPKDELDRFGLTEQEMAAGADGGTKPAFLKLMHFQVERARSFYERSSPLEQRVRPDARPTLIAMTGIYRGILEKIAADPGRVMRQRVRLATLTKLLIAWRAMRAK